jgi:hypothetical protein
MSSGTKFAIVLKGLVRAARLQTERGAQRYIIIDHVMCYRDNTRVQQDPARPQAGELGTRLLRWNRELNQTSDGRVLRLRLFGTGKPSSSEDQYNVPH